MHVWIFGLPPAFPNVYPGKRFHTQMSMTMLKNCAMEAENSNYASICAYRIEHYFAF